MDRSYIKKPVMVWIHGGGFCAESQASPLYDLTGITKQCPDILFVSIDYRLGFLGFMNFERVPGGENFKDACNLGLLDQLEALRWIQKNIACPGELRIEKGLLADQYKAVLHLLNYYQFMDKYFTPGYMLDILAAREQKA